MTLTQLSIDLIQTSDPLKAIFSALNDVWVPRDSDVDNFYTERERETNRIEVYIRDTYFEVYDLLLQRIRGNDTAEWLSQETGPILFMDGLSIREANLLRAFFEQQGFEIIEYTHGFSQIPSDTQPFLRKVFGMASLQRSRKWNDFQIIPIPSGEVPTFLPQEEKVILWLSFPDEILHHTRGRVATPSEALAKSKEALSKIIARLQPKQLTVTSDHGYLYVKFATLFWKMNRSDERMLRGAFGASRGLPLDEVNPDLERLRGLGPDQSYVTFDKEGCYVRGRYYWGVSGKQSDIAHGGLSFMECLTPIIRLSRR